MSLRVFIYYFSFIAVLCTVQLSLAQKKADSVHLLLVKAKHDTIRIDRGIEYAQLIRQSDQDSAIAVLFSAAKIAERIRDTVRFLRAHYLLGGLLFDESKYTEVLEHTQLVISIAPKTGNRKLTAAAYNLAGNTYQQLGQFDRALDHLLKSLKIREEIGDLKLIANSYANIGNLHIRQKDYPGALEYIRKSMSTHYKSGDTMSIAGSNASLGLAFFGMKNLDSAKKYLDIAVHYSELKKELLSAAINKVNLATVLKNSGRKNEALAMYKNCLEVFERKHYLTGIAAASGEIGEVYVEQNKFELAIPFIRRAIDVAHECGNRDQESVHLMNMSAALKGIGRYKEAFDYYDRGVKLSDSVQNEESRKVVTRRELQYEFQKRTAADSIKNAKAQEIKDAFLLAQKAKLEQENMRFWLLAAGLAIVGTGLLLVVNRFRITRKQKLIIEQQKKEVDDAFTKLAVKNKEVTDSIYYARRIQRALITSEKYIFRNLRRMNGE